MLVSIKIMLVRLYLLNFNYRYLITSNQFLNEKRALENNYS